MSINNKRSFLQENESEKKIKQSLKENYSRFITEEEDEMLDDELGGDIDAELDGTDLDSELDGESEITPDASLETEELTPSQGEQVENWIDDLLTSTISTETEDSEMGLDLEDDAEVVEPEQTLNANVPISAEDMENIIDNEDSLDVLETTLQDIAINGLEDEDALVEGKYGASGKDTFMTPQNTERNPNDNSKKNAEIARRNVERELKQLEDEDEDSLDEAISMLESELLNNAILEVEELLEEKEVKSKTEENFGKVTGKEKNVSIEDSDFEKEGDKVENAKEGDKVNNENKSNLKESLESKTADLEKLKFENYKLSRVNGLLIVAGEKLNEKSRMALSEGFKKCKDKSEVEKIYTQVVERLKESENKRTNLNESVSKKTNIIKESKNKETLSLGQERINFLMGVKGSKNMYGRF